MQDFLVGSPALIKMNKSRYFLLNISVAAVLIILSLKYCALKEESLVLKLKLRTLSNNKVKSKSWVSFKKEASKLNKDIPSKIKKVESILKSPTKYSTDELTESLDTADELISMDPNVFSSYKAKLILLLVDEGKKGKRIWTEEIEDLLLTMASFDVASNESLRDEAILIASANLKLGELAEDLDLLEESWQGAIDDREELMYELSILDKLDEIDFLEEEVEDKILKSQSYVSEDLIELPLLRNLAFEDYDSVIDNSLALLRIYPDSVSGYFYLIRALELEGRHEEAYEFLEDVDFSPEEMLQLEKRLLNSRNESPKNYWRNLRF